MLVLGRLVRTHTREGGFSSVATISRETCILPRRNLEGEQRNRVGDSSQLPSNFLDRLFVRVAFRRS